MNLVEAADKLASALTDACNQHGRPNSFSPRELFEFHGGPPPKLAGRVMKSHRKETFRIKLDQKGWRGPYPQYVGSRFEVTSDRTSCQT